MPSTMKKTDVIYGPVDGSKVKFTDAAKALDKYFGNKNGGFTTMALQKATKSAMKKASTKGAYVKIGKVGSQIVMRVKTTGALKSTHLADDVIVEDTAVTQKLVDSFSKPSFDKAMATKSSLELYKEFGNDPQKGGIGNEIGFWEIAGTKGLKADKKKKIYELFIDTSGKYEVNISGTERKKLKQLADADNFDEMDFTKARNEIFVMLRGNFGSLQSSLADKNWNKFWK